jgi:hypothetical protein
MNWKSFRHIYGAGPTTFPLAVRLALTGLSCAWLAFLVFQIVAWAQADDPRPAAFHLLLLAFSIGLSVPVFHSLWRPSAHVEKEWEGEEQERRHIADRCLPQSPHPGLTTTFKHGIRPPDVGQRGKLN